jgi:hypothetical protein
MIFSGDLAVVLVSLIISLPALVVVGVLWLLTKGKGTHRD